MSDRKKKVGESFSRKVPSMRSVFPQRLFLRLSACAGLLLACGLARAAAAPAQGGSSQRLEQDFPGVRTTVHDGRVIQVFGVPMTEAATPDEAASGWLSAYGQAFGAGALETRLLRAHDVGFGKFTVYQYEQLLDGVPVEQGRVKILVRNIDDGAGLTHKVVLAGARVTGAPAGGFAPDAIDAAGAIEKARSIARFADLQKWSRPTMTVFFGEGDLDAWTAPSRAWKFSAENYADPQNPRSFTFFVDAATGELLHARSDISHIDVTGRVEGLSSPNNTAHHAGNPPVIFGLPDIKVTNTDTGSFVYTDADGNFTLPNAGTVPVNLLVTTGDGRWASAVNTVGANISVSQSATPGTPATINVNPVHSEVTTAQVNAFIHQTATHNFFKNRAPAFTALDFQLPCNVQVTGTCNAFYNGSSTNYYPIGGDCNNTAFSSVVNHEYGHHIVNRLALAQGAFGEGFGDVMSILIQDDAVLGRFFFTNGGAVRNANNVQSYPCASTAIHTCGQILAGSVWAMRNQFVTRYGTALGLDTYRQLAIDWAVVTDGGLGLNSAHPATVIEWLTVDDDDMNLCNGTPNQTQITAAFASRNVTAPGITLNISAGQNPLQLSVTGPTRVSVIVQECTATFNLAGSSVVYSVNGGSSQTVPLFAGPGADEYSANIPAVPCPSTTLYSFSLSTSAGVITWPQSDGVLAPISAQGGEAVIATSFESGTDGWTVGPDTAIRGNWQLGVPESTAAQPGADATPGAGVNCWATGLLAGSGLGSFDVDDGQTILTSPAFDLSGQTGVVASYRRWYSTGAGALPYADVLRVQVSVNNGTTWTDAEVVGPANSADTNPGWRDGGFSFAALGLTPSAQTRVRFIAEDLAGQGSIVEAAIDDFAFRNGTCGSSGCDSIDFNNDQVSPDNQDLIDFLSVFGGGPCSTGNCNDIDFNNDSVAPDSQDLTDLLNVFGGGTC
jgi:Zn-dependent metalloprotease